MFEGIADTTLAALVGLAGGIMLGLAARLGRFCTLGAIEDMLYQRSSVRIRMWLVAIGVAIVGTYSLIGLGAMQADSAIYLKFAWNPAASVIGGLVFGYGMALAGNCGYGALARLGGGDMRSFVIVLVMGISAYVTISGPLAWLRVALFPTPPLNGAPVPGMAQALAGLTGLPAVAIGLASGAALLALALASRRFTRRPGAVFWGAVVGLAIVTGWAGTSWIAANGFDPVPVESHTFSAPLGDTILYAMTASGSSLNFGIGSVLGVLLGAFAGSLIKGHFRWEACEDPRELRRQILGAALMGVGALLAFGCTIGQGVSAFSVLFFGAPVAFLSIIAGAPLGWRPRITGLTSARSAPRNPPARAAHGPRFFCPENIPAGGTGAGVSPRPRRDAAKPRRNTSPQPRARRPSASNSGASSMRAARRSPSISMLNSAPCAIIPRGTKPSATDFPAQWA